MFWMRHRVRQAGKYAKKSYQYQVTQDQQNNMQTYYNLGWFDFYGKQEDPNYVTSQPSVGYAYGYYRNGWMAAKKRFEADQRLKANAS